MKKSNKIMSLLLAFAMIFTAVVPALANTEDAAKSETKKDNTVKINVSASKDGKFDGVNQKVTLYVDKTGKEGKDFQQVDWGVTENGKHTFELKSPLLPEATYTIVVGDMNPNVSNEKAYNAKLVVPGTQWKYSFNTDPNGKPIELKEEYHFDLYVEPKSKEFFVVTTLTKDAKTAPFQDFSIVPLKVNEDKTAYTGKDGGYLVDTDRKALFTGKTDKYGEYGLTKEKVQELATAADYSIGEGKYATTVVGFVVNGELVAVADFNRNSSDRAAYLRPVDVITKLVVTVEGDNRMVDIHGEEALTPLKGATVELQGNTTEWQKEESFGKVLATQTTNEEGKAVFENPDLVSFIRVLDATNTAREGYFTNIPLYNRVAVVKAEGYRVPQYATLEGVEMKDNVMHVKFTLIPEGGIHTNRIKGSNRYATSVEVAKNSFKGPQKEVILASGDIYADALVANGLVGLKHAPLVLNGVSKLDKTVAEYLKDVEAKKVTIIGGNSAISGSVQDELEKIGLKTERIAGTNRYETSVKVLQHFLKNGQNMKVQEGDVRNVFLASGENFADALVASVPAAMYARPILLTSKDSLPKVVKDAIENKDYGIKEVTVVGGTGAVSEKAYAQITVSNVQRLKGQNRQLTAMAVADQYFMNAGQAIIVDGTNFADALAAGQLGWKIKAPILLSESKTVLGKDLAKYLRDNKMTEITIVGGTSSVSEGIAKELDQIIVGK
ncbi:cell wall-binding repeat-containing protein [Mediannikoviicoccus vaginalis]|uniref:cell wall-binding repeat-containing protein n=1 Tax=Mediannikoviicoccus vaginalis TaxID=2899727 RepID=UPI001F1C8CD7|nr:cell wall-binding repeat-containing protein [Mediannikoviicoccus vaginalis]